MIRLALIAVVLLGVGSARVEGRDAAEVGVVASITDGDTLRLESGQRIRLLQIDAPELRDRECFATAARRALAWRAPVGSRIVLEADPALDRADRYGRLLRYVRKGTMNVNVALVRAGAAAPYFHDRELGRHASQLLGEARRARAARRGLWRACPGTELDPYRLLDTGLAQGSRRIGDVGGCDPSYTGACVPPYPPDLDCGDLRSRGIRTPLRVVGDDPHRLDGDGDGLGCEPPG